MILAGDVGGTNTRLAGFDLAAGALALRVEATYPSREFAGLDEIVAAFVAAHDLTIRHACIGVAGPVREGRCATTNLPWHLDERRLAASLGLPHATLINDLEAIAFGVPLLARADLAVLQEGDADAVGNRAIVAAGTGLGEAGLTGTAPATIRSRPREATPTSPRTTTSRSSCCASSGSSSGG